MSVRRTLSPDIRSPPGPPPVPTSRGPLLSSRRAHGGPPRTPPTRSSLLYSTRLRDASSAADPQNCMVHGISRCGTRSLASMTAAVADEDPLLRAKGGGATGSEVSEAVAAPSSSMQFDAVRSNSRPFDAVRSNSGQFDAVRSNSGPFDAVRSNSGPFDAVRSNSGPFDAVRSNSRPFDAVRSNSGQFDAVRSNSGQFDAVRSNSGPFDAVRSNRAPWGSAANDVSEADEAEPAPRAPRPHPADQKIFLRRLPTPVLKPPALSLMDEVNEWARLLQSWDAGVQEQEKYLRHTDAALHAIGKDMEALCADQRAVDTAMCDAKARYIAHVDNVQRGRTAAMRHVRDAEADDGELDPEWEAWRIEKGELLARKSTLLQKHKELRHHIRRGTHIKNVSAIANIPLMRGRLVDGNDEGNARNSGGDPQRFSASASHALDDRALIDLRMEIKQCEVSIAKFAENQRVLTEAQRSRERVFEEEHSRLLREAEAATRTKAVARRELQDQLGRAERLWQSLSEREEDSLAVALERGIAEARTALAKKETSASASAAAGGGGGFRPRMASIGQNSLQSAQHTSGRRARSMSTSVNTTMATTESFKQKCVERRVSGNSGNGK